MPFRTDSASLPVVKLPYLTSGPPLSTAAPVCHIGEMSYKPTYHLDVSPFSAITSRTNNVPDRFESFLLGDGEKKVTIKPETRVPNATLFLFAKEDHTLGNLLRSQLLTNPAVLFSGYKVPHPLFPDFELRVQTDGSITPKEALMTACREIVRQLQDIKQVFQSEWELKRVSRLGEEGQALEHNGYGVNGYGAGPSGVNGYNAGYGY